MAQPNLSHREHEPNSGPRLHKMFFDRMQEAYNKQPPQKNFSPPTNESYLEQADTLKECITQIKPVSANELDRFYRGYYPEGWHITIAALPFTEHCVTAELLKKYGEWDEFESGKRYMYQLMTNPQTGLTHRFSFDLPMYLQDVLPEILTRDVEKGGCSFLITAEMLDDPALLIANVNGARRNLIRFLTENPNFDWPEEDFKDSKYW